MSRCQPHDPCSKSDCRPFFYAGSLFSRFRALIVLVWLLVSASNSWGQFSFKTLYSFTGGPDGGMPLWAPQYFANGMLYGTTGWDGEGNGAGSGTIYSFSLHTGTLSTLAQFDLNTTGAHPDGGIAFDSAGNMYGTTNTDGPGGLGNLWELPKGSNTISQVTTFGTDGYAAGPVYLDSSGNIIGTTSIRGNIFKYSLSKGTLTKIPTPLFAESIMPDSKGNYWGVSGGGGPSSLGTLFELRAGANLVTTVLSFDGSNGPPEGQLAVDPSGNLFGTTGDGRYYPPEVYEVPAGTNTIHTVAQFDATTLFPSSGPLFLDKGGDIFGTTSEGGSGGDGVIYEIPAGTNTINPIVDFSGLNGSGPIGGLYYDGAGDLFGATETGGTHNAGTIFELSGIPIPEPSSQSLILIIVVGILFRRRTIALRLPANDFGDTV